MHFPPDFYGKLRDYGELSIVRALSSGLSLFYPPNLQPDNNIISDDFVRSNNSVETFWNKHTVTTSRFRTTWESDHYFRWLCRTHPLLFEYMEFDTPRAGQRVLDYGCGPGNDVYRLLVQSNADRVSAVDVSRRAIELARKRLALYPAITSRVEFKQIRDSEQLYLPFDAASFDHINCAGVLMHTSDPRAILSEFRRVLKHTGDALVMVYVKPSVYYHLYVPWFLQLYSGRFQGMSTDEAFQRSTDGENCPISKCFTIPDFEHLAHDAGFSVEYRGGYFTRTELWVTKRFLGQALNDFVLSEVHRTALARMSIDERGFPCIESGFTAGLSGVFRLVPRL